MPSDLPQSEGGREALSNADCLQALAQVHESAGSLENLGWAGWIMMAALSITAFALMALTLLCLWEEFTGKNDYDPQCM